MKEGSSHLTLIEIEYRNKDVYGAISETITHHKKATLHNCAFFVLSQNVLDFCLPF